MNNWTDSQQDRKSWMDTVQIPAASIFITSKYR